MKVANDHPHHAGRDLETLSLARLKERIRFGTGMLLGLFICLWFSLPEPVAGQEAMREDQPPPKSVEEMDSPLKRAFRERIEAKRLFPRLRRQLDEMSPFFRDTEVHLKPRTYYFNRKNLDGSRSEALATGGSVAYRSGWFMDHFSVGAEYYLSQKLDGDKDRDGTRLLKPGQHSYDVLGQLYGEARYENLGLRAYRQELSLPYVNKQDSRMTPNTFEAYFLRSLSNNIPRMGGLDYGVGYVREMKKRDSDEFVSMSEAAGAPGEDEGMFLGGFRLRPIDAFSAGAVNYYVDDVINIAYGEASYSWRAPQDFGLRFDAQFTDQRSVGKDRLTGDNFNTQVWGGRFSASFRDVVASLAVSSTSSDEKIRNPFGSYPGYISLMQRDFNRAGEDAWLAGVSYNLRRFSLDELSLSFNYAEGYNAREASTGARLGDQQEWNLTLDYRITEGPVSGLWARLRGSLLDVEGEPHTSEELRAILYYSARIL